MLLEETHVSLPSHVAIGPDASELGSIRKPAITMSVWERSLCVSLAAAVRETLASGFEEVRLTLALDEVALAFVERLVVSGVSPVSAVKLSSDIALLGRHFADVMGCGRLDIRLERVRRNACRKFHADYVMARLITTYSGRATEWLDQSDAARFRQGSSLDDLRVRSLREGDVALLKGKFWADEEAIIHRSPPIAGTGEQRLLLVINPSVSPHGEPC